MLKAKTACYLTWQGRFKNEIQRSRLVADAVYCDSLFCRGPGTCANQRRCCHDPLHDVIANRCFAGGNFDSDCSSPPQLHRGGVFNSYRADWSLRGIAVVDGILLREISGPARTRNVEAPRRTQRPVRRQARPAAALRRTENLAGHRLPAELRVYERQAAKELGPEARGQGGQDLNVGGEDFWSYGLIATPQSGFCRLIRPVCPSPPRHVRP